MVYLIDELERQGLAERRSVSGDRRAYAIHLTDAGRQRLAVVAVPRATCRIAFSRR
jgi:DNA-binding MarR family transcriptional regulator